MVLTGLFTEIRIQYLPVGHTHENIDQFFSRIAIALRKKDRLTPEEIWAMWEASFAPTPTVITKLEYFDYKAWLLPFINKKIPNIHSMYAARIYLNAQGKVSFRALHAVRSLS